MYFIELILHSGYLGRLRKKSTNLHPPDEKIILEAQLYFSAWATDAKAHMAAVSFRPFPSRLLHMPPEQREIKICTDGNAASASVRFGQPLQK